MLRASHPGICCSEVERTDLGFLRWSWLVRVKLEWNLGPLPHRLHFLSQEWTIRLFWLSSRCWMAKEQSLTQQDKVSMHRLPFSRWVSICPVHQQRASGSHAEHVRFVGHGRDCPLVSEFPPFLLPEPVCAFLCPLLREFGSRASSLGMSRSLDALQPSPWKSCFSFCRKRTTRVFQFMGQASDT